MNPLWPTVVALLLAPAPTAWTVVTLAGTGQAGTSGDGGPALAALLDQPFGLLRGPDGAVWVCEYHSGAVRRITAEGRVESVVPADGTFREPHEIRFDAAGDLWVADTGHHRVAKVDLPAATISTVAGSGVAGFAGDGGAATAAQLRLPISIQFNAAGDLFICDIGNHRVRRVDHASGVISTYAGTGQRGPTPDGARYAEAPLNGPRSLDIDAAGNLWLALREGNQVWRLDAASGTATRVAGSGKPGYSGDGGPALAATLSGPKGLALNAAGTRLYLADTESSTIRVIDVATGRIDLVAGTGRAGRGADGPAAACALARPHGIAVDLDGSLLVGDSYNHLVRQIRPAQD
ncbi:MAG: hypothetical protein IT204_20935 [Fimbriimonadaceae bacterium]|nr:hypothetical protein [Fimbriimonadaceae bacterium]